MTANLPAAAIVPPGVYMRKRREASGFSVGDIAIMLGGKDVAARAAFKIAIDSLEAGDAGAYDELVAQLAGAFAFDLRVYDALVLYQADDRTPVPPICRVCACSYFDACLDQADEPCGWAQVGADEAPLCTMCIDDGEPDTGEAQPLPPANDLGEGLNAA